MFTGVAVDGGLHTEATQQRGGSVCCAIAIAVSSPWGHRHQRDAASGRINDMFKGTTSRTVVTGEDARGVACVGGGWCSAFRRSTPHIGPPRYGLPDSSGRSVMSGRMSVWLGAALVTAGVVRGRAAGAGVGDRGDTIRVFGGLPLLPWTARSP